MSDKLKPCPFCGVMPEIEELSNGYMIECVSGKCQATVIVSYDKKHDAIKAWNCRSPLSELMKTGVAVINEAGDIRGPGFDIALSELESKIEALKT